MPLSPTSKLMADAFGRKRGLAAFNIIHLETAEALVAGAEMAGLPLILQISENCVKYHGGLVPLTRAAQALADRSTVPIALHLDHAEDEHLAMEAVDLGFGSVMYDGAHLDYEDNVNATARIARYAHARGVYVEAELGKVGGKDGAHAPGVRTDPQEAVAFVAATNVDALAVAVGSSHAMTAKTSTVDMGLIAALRRETGVPLVLHGSSGVPDQDLVSAIRSGMTKINVSTHLNCVFTRAVREYLEANPAAVDSRKYIKAGREALVPEVARLITLINDGR
ncbi:class II fructose-bisphosphate aldolase [Pseudarthrobacter sp. AL07]|uniref:class II fructose-bisphosphate aldolase n=1 Tax=unclassified Pseudarthrobacter TaxID=2647000 RepID=UPI00249CE5E3|nr:MULTISPECIES: class II fructose-bisphosphate aldolase [unclassified Pseudarthrobacter]MDI3193853.1 class II fructose-bisphosphate aldolase [Pseudarthrobacter sp. AL20]MDI3207637.1 class II fructose-bisphosphate aldolase [Pseudarthrobacter sp. AL07]